MVHHIVAAVIVQTDRILLGRRSPDREFDPNVWDVFGGHIEPGEERDHTLVRELQEELGITPRQWMELEMITESVPRIGESPAYDLVVYFYCLTSWSGTPVNLQPHEHTTIQWFSYAEAIELDLAHPSYPRLFAQCLQSIAEDE